MFCLLQNIFLISNVGTRRVDALWGRGMTSHPTYLACHGDLPKPSSDFVAVEEMGVLGPSPSELHVSGFRIPGGLSSSLSLTSLLFEKLALPITTRSI